ncbi:hypothetical protein LSP17_03465 [Pseudomonas aeruginosa]|uniref:DUF7673 family protein n=1 Tax=Pseudomonas aeruginosa TaxID=287 RepID=UPI001E4DA93B|nr:hypothetical protein [Pseudomonas aeruginosa]UGR28906.1 hypothetical protein LSP17_03465 [Pseudomonas aeruginosa]
MNGYQRWQADLARIAAEEAERPAIRAAGMEALQRLLPVAQRDTGQSRIVGRFLLSLYNGNAFPFCLTDLRGLDTQLWEDCLALLRLDRRPEVEIHQYVQDGEHIWSALKQAWA